MTQEEYRYVAEFTAPKEISKAELTEALGEGADISKFAVTRHETPRTSARRAFLMALNQKRERHRIEEESFMEATILEAIELLEDSWDMEVGELEETEVPVPTPSESSVLLCAGHECTKAAKNGIQNGGLLYCSMTCLREAMKE